MGGDGGGGIGEVAGAGTAHGGETQLPGPGERHGNHPILEGKGGHVYAIVLDVEVLEPEAAGKAVAAGFDRYEKTPKDERSDKDPNRKAVDVAQQAALKIQAGWVKK